MNKLTTIILHSSFFVLHLAAVAAIPQRWTVETSRVKPAQFEAFHGETINMRASFFSYGSPLALPADADYRLFWQTNGMDVYWSTSAVLVSSNTLAAVFLPKFDPGTTMVKGFLGIPADNYHAAFTIRFYGSPGATPFDPPPLPQAEYYTKPEVDSRIGAATNGIRKVDGAARPLPAYLHAFDFDDSYPDAAAAYYRSRGNGKVDGGCSAVRDGNCLYRNFDYPFDDRAEFVVRMSASTTRFASVGVAQVGTNLTEQIVTSGRPSPCYKWLPGATVDGINEHGVVAEINVVDGEPPASTGGDIHPLAAVRWALDNGTSAEMVATNLAARIAFPAGWEQNFHWMIADATSTWIVENGAAHKVTGRAAMTNFPLYPTRGSGEGQERYDALMGGSNITSQWWTLTYTPGGYRASDLPGIDSNLVFAAWASKPRESHRGETFGDVAWWQTVHTSVYDITNRTLRIAVQERDDWYVFSVPQGGKVKSVNGQTGDVVLAGEDVISDLATIRSGAALGATAVQPSAIADMETQTHAAQTYQPKGSYLTSETDPTVSSAISTHNSSTSAHSDIRTAIAGKQATISDLATIRSGAAAGATAVQPAAISDMETQTHAAATYQPKGSYLTSESDPTVSSTISTHNSSTSAHSDIRTAAANAQAHSEATRQIVYTWEDFLDGSNVVISITNYISGAYSLDEAKLQIKELIPDSNEYRIVYDSRIEITNHTAAAKREIVGYVDGVATELRGEIAEKGDKAWGRRSSTGQDVPISNTVWVTEQNLRIAGGMEYERVAVGEGAIYVLCSKGQTPYMTGDEGALMLKDDGGTNYFGMVRSDSYTIGCNTDGIRKENDLVYLDFSVTMSDHPCIWYTASLGGDVEWEQLNLPDGSAVPGASHVVVWDESPRLGAQECYINCENKPGGFFRATIEVAGDARFRTNMPAEIPSFYCADDPTKKVKIIWNNGNPKFVEAN